MPELRLVVLALQDRLAYGPNFDAAMAGLFGGATSSLSAEPRPAPSAAAGKPPAAPGTPEAPANTNALIAGAAQDLADYQRLTAEGKLGEAGRKLEELKAKLEMLNRIQR